MPNAPLPHAEAYRRTQEDGAAVPPAESRSFGPPPSDSLSFPFIAGRAELSVRLSARPVFDLRRRERVGLHLSRALSRAFPAAGPFGGGRPRLEPGDILKLDAGSLRQGLDLAQRHGPGAVVIPACWSTVRCSRGRFSLLYAGLEGDPDVVRLLLEVLAAPPDADPDDLEAAVSHIEAQQRGVLLRAPNDLRALERLAGAGLSGVSLDLSALALDTAIGRQTALQLMVAARRAAPSVMLLGLPGSLAEEAAQAGATHAVMCERVAVTV